MVHVLFLSLFILLEDEWFRTTEAVVNFPYLVRIRQNQSSVFTRQAFGEFVVLLQGPRNTDIGVEENGQDSLSGAGIVHDLPGEEQVFVVHC